MINLKSCKTNDGTNSTSALRGTYLKRATKTLAWIRRFIDNNRVKEKVKTKKELLSTHETEFKLMEMIKIYQNNLESKTLKHVNLNKQNTT